MKDTLFELIPGNKVPHLTKDCVRVGKFNFWGVHNDDLTAEFCVFKEESIGLIMPVAKNIEKLLLRLDTLDPTDRSRVEYHARRCVEEGYIGAFARMLELDFEEEIIDSWRQGYGYRWVPDENHHVRLVVLMPEHEDDEPALKRMAQSLITYHKKHGYDVVDAAPSHGADAYHRRQRPQ